jgi:hypothetical protein
MSWLRDRGLFLVLFALFLIFLFAVAFAGWDVNNQELLEHGAAPLSLLAYLASPEFGEAVFENWESEFLQMAAYVVLTIWLFQRGSSESRPVGERVPQDEDPRRHRHDPKAPWPVRRGGVVLVLYENSLLIFFGVLFLAAFALHVVTGAAAYSEEQVRHGGSAVTPGEYLATSQLWFESFQNWQSEFLAVALLVGASVYLRQRGSPESKPVATPHAETGA